MPDLLFRPLEADELDLFNRYPTPPTSGVGARGRSFDEFVAAGDYRPEWTWVALRGGEVVARAAFWAPPGFAHPFSLDWFDPGAGPDRVEVGAALLRAAYSRVATADYVAPPHPEGGRPDYHLFLPADWRERPDARADALDRISAAEQAGLGWSSERLNLRWTPADGLPARSTRLRFGPATDDDLVTEVLARIFRDTLDVDVRADVDRHGVRRAAELTLAEVSGMPGGRGWWRLAYHATASWSVSCSRPATPARRRSATSGVPEHRGHRYADDLVAEALHRFTEAGEVMATTAPTSTTCRWRPRSPQRLPGHRPAGRPCGSEGGGQASAVARWGTVPPGRTRPATGQGDRWPGDEVAGGSTSTPPAASSARVP